MLIYNLSLSETTLLLVIALYWFLITNLIGWIIFARAVRNSVDGSKRWLLVGASIGTLGVIIFAHLRWTIFGTFQEDPVSAFLFILFINLFGSLGALIGFHIKRIRSLF